jgi:hypothetical protein
MVHLKSVFTRGRFFVTVPNQDDKCHKAEKSERDTR